MDLRRMVNTMKGREGGDTLCDGSTVDDLGSLGGHGGGGKISTGDGQTPC